MGGLNEKVHKTKKFKAKLEKPARQVNSRLLEASVATRWKPGQSGNPAGAKPKEKMMSFYLKKALDEPYGDGRTYGEVIAERAIFEAAEGNFVYFKELLDRVEGKVAQKVEAKTEITQASLVDLLNQDKK